MNAQVQPAYAVVAGRIDADREALLALWQGNLGDAARMRRKYDWFYAGCPMGEPSVCLLRHADETPVGVASAGARRMCMDGVEVGAGVLVDLAVAAEHRSLGPALMLQAALAEAALQRFAFLYGFPNAKAVPVFKRVGHAALGEMLRLVRVVRHARYLDKRLPRPLALLAAPFLDLATRLADAWRARADQRLTRRWRDRSDPRFDALWRQAAPQKGVFAVRDLDYARWRFDACPLEQTRFLLLEAGAQLQAWFACQCRGATLVVCDYWSVDGERGIARAHVDALLAAAREAGHESVSVELCASAQQLEGWYAAGFQVRGRRPVFGRWRAPRTADAGPIFLTAADEDE